MRNYWNSLQPISEPRISDPQCGTIREVGINFKSKKSGEIIREAVLLEGERKNIIRKNTIRKNMVDIIYKVCKGTPMEYIFWFFFWKYHEIQNPLYLLVKLKCAMSLELKKKLFRCHISLSLLFVYLKVFLPCKNSNAEWDTVKSLNSGHLRVLRFVRY